MKRVSAIHKIFLLAVIMICLFTPFTAFAQETVLKTTVPYKISLKIEIEGNGSVEVNGNKYSKTAEIIIEQNDTEFKIIPEKGNIIKSIAYNGTDITAELKNNILRLNNIEDNAVLKVVFAEENTALKTGEPVHNLWLFGTAILISGIGIAFIISKRIIKN